jgi:RNA 2',3'-cyclic 3'-phosphodiesterase
MRQGSESIRAFVAVELPDEVRKGLVGLTDQLKKDDHRFVKWVAPEGIHLTLKFLGNVPSEQVPEISGALKEAAGGVPPFQLNIAGLGVFPGLKQVRVFWVGIRGEVDTLSRLQENIDSALAPLRFAREERRFVPHLTLARIRQDASPSQRRSFGELIDSVVFADEYQIEVTAVSLMRSQLTTAGAVYTRLSTAALGNQP